MVNLDDRSHVTVFVESKKAWYLVEIQGELSEMREDLDVGKISFLPNKIDAIWDIGYHRLEGRLEDSKKSYAVVKDDPTTKGRRKIVGVVSKTIVFRSRPKPKRSKHV